MKKPVYLAMTALLLLLLCLGGCSDPNPAAPSPQQAHPADWLAGHARDPQAQGAAERCQTCHGDHFEGSGAAVSCYGCHSSGPPFSIHPAAWSDPQRDHRSFALQLSWTTCAAAVCHGATLHGGSTPQQTPTGPSCFSSATPAVLCHDAGPPRPHAAYAPPALHGSAAKGSTDPQRSLIYCRNCHGRPDNLFDGGMVAAAEILNRPEGQCNACHRGAGAHPTHWQGTNDTADPYSHPSTHRTINPALISSACALCHGTAGTTPGPLSGAPSCFTSNFTNSAGSSTNCHPSGPGQPPHQLPFTDPNLHGPAAKADLTYCQTCHAEAGGPGSNPRFNVAVGNLTAGCEDCHAFRAAHPPTAVLASTDRWTFRGDPATPRRTHFAAGNVLNACTLCHGAALDGTGGVGPSCFSCHVSAPQFRLRCDYCHGNPPIGAADLTGAATPVNHTTVSDPTGFATAHDACSLCHGAKNDGTGRLTAAGSDYLLLDKLSPSLRQGGDHLDGRLEMNGPAPGAGAGYNAATFGCDSACHANAAPFRLSAAGLPLAYGNYGNQPAAGCTTCHGYPPDGSADLTGATPVDHVGTDPAGFLGAHNDCVVCHGARDDGTGHLSAVANYSIAADHRDGSIQMNSATAYDQATFGCASACHGNVAPYRLSDSGLPVALADFGSSCDSCHTSGVGGAPVVIGVTSPHTSVWTCSDCHTGHGSGSVIIPNNPSVGINYANDTEHLGGISLGGPAAPGATEAEICWGCHDLYAVSEWGTNQKSITGNSLYDYGTLWTSNALTSRTSNWIGAWWKSGTAAFAYKTGRIQSTHAANPAATAAGIDTIGQLRCSYCHDVHDLNRAPGDTTSGKPYLRGSWKGNPYREDGAPQAGTAYLNLQKFGAVPRGNIAQTTMGGYWIDQNSGNPSNGFTLVNSAGLCTLCHGSNVNSLNQFGTAANAWIGSNGHANSTIGGTGVGAANIFDLRGGVRGDNVNPAMAFQGASDPGNNQTLGFRNTGGDAAGWTPRLNPVGETRNYSGYEWGATVDATTTNLQYHKFSCSKCHNPHASRLPRLLLTNCLDTKHNTWDNSYQLAAAPQAGGNNSGRSLSNWTSAQNCHRLGGNDPSDSRDAAGTGTGWNRVTPWTTEGTQDNGAIP